MKTKLGILAVACVVLFVSGCGSSPQDQILGKWEAGESGVKLTAEFARGGKAKLTMFGKTLRGTYKLNGDELEWTVNGKTTKSKIKVTTTEMELSSEGNTIKYKKV
jgi:uncharacterized protein (TIGR03066 family)